MNRLMLPLVALSLLCAPCAKAEDRVRVADTKAPDRKATFDPELAVLRSQSMTKVGRQLLRSYEAFIDRHIDDPRVADAMLDIASEYGTTIPAQGIVPDGKAALRWTRKAAAKAVVGSKTWVRANLLLASSFTDLDESRRILAIVAKQCPNQQDTLVRIEYFQTVMFIKEGNLLEAERHALVIMNWYNAPKRPPIDAHVKQRIAVERLTVAHELLSAWATAPWPLAERKRKVLEFLSRHSQGGSIQQDGESALRQIEEERVRRIRKANPSPDFAT